jgi:hypothetical protein
MIIGYARVSTTEQNLGLEHDDLKPASFRCFGRSDRRSHGDRPCLWPEDGRITFHDALGEFPPTAVRRSLDKIVRPAMG